MPRTFNSSWSAVCWYVSYCLQGGIEISIPCASSGSIIPSSQGSAPKHDEQMGEQAALALRIVNMIRASHQGGYLAERDVKTVLRGAQLQVLFDLSMNYYEVAILNYRRTNRVPGSKKNGRTPSPPRGMSMKDKIVVRAALDIVPKMNHSFEELLCQ